MPDLNTVFLYGTGASSVTRVPELIRGLLAKEFTVYSVLTPNVAHVTPPAPLMEIEGNHWIHAYRQPPLDRFPFGIHLVAPCTFNSFNKIANGLADNLATAMIADALGASYPIIIAPSMNPGLWNHPHTQLSLERFQAWGCHVVAPQASDTQVTMAPTAKLIDTVVRISKS